MEKFVGLLKEMYPALARYGLVTGAAILLLFFFCIRVVFESQVSNLFQRFKDFIREGRTSSDEDAQLALKKYCLFAGLIIVGVLCGSKFIFKSGMPNLFRESKKSIQSAGTSSDKDDKPVPTHKTGNESQADSSEESSDSELAADSTVNPTSSSIKQFSGVLKGGDSDEKDYKSGIAGVYRFDFDIDDVNKEYIFYILDENGEEIARESSNSEDGVTVTLEESVNYTLGVENSSGDDTVNYCVSVNAPDSLEVVEGKEIEGNLRYVDQQNEYIYVAPRSGTYRFDLDIDDVSKVYYFYVYDSKNKKLLDVSSSDEGETVELDAGATYKCVVVQQTEFPSYKVTIGVPNGSKKVQNGKIKGAIKYTDQCDTYSYKAPLTGRYRFDFGIDDVNKDYHFTLLSTKNEIITESRFSDSGDTVELEKGVNYTIKVEYDGSFAKYNIKVNAPNKTISVSNNVVKGTIGYVDQHDTYEFRPSRSGNFHFKFGINDVECSYNVYLYDSKNKEMFQVYSSDEEYDVELKRNKKYKLYIDYSEGFPKYTVTIK